MSSIRRYALTAFGRDRPGIVAAVTGALYRAGLNLESSAMTRLAGQFAVIVVASQEGRAGLAAIRRELAHVKDEMGLEVHVRALTDDDAEAPPAAGGRPYLITVAGADHPGIVHGIAEVLAARSVNITDLQSEPAGDPERPVYVMVIEVELPPRLREASLRRELERVSRELGVEIQLRADEAPAL